MARQNQPLCAYPVADQDFKSPDSPADNRCHESFGFHRKFGPEPLVPASLQNIGLAVPLLHEFPRHTGTGPLAGSGSVENQCLVLGVLIHPRVNLVRILAHRAFDLELTCRPI